MENVKSSHQQTPSINSLGSIVEPLTPPDLGDQFNYAQNPQFSSAGNATNPHFASSTPLSALNTNIGGNTFRSRFKSLPLVTELDYKFSQFNINNLQKLSTSSSATNGSTNNFTPSPSLSSNTSTCSIPQISLQQYQLQLEQQDKNRLQNQNLSQSQTQRQSPGQAQAQSYQYQSHPQRQRLQQHGSLPTLQLHHNRRDSSSSSTSTSNYKNYDELNLIPVEKLDILKLSVDQYGCRFLQKKLEMDNSFKDVIFNKIFANMIELIVDPFGNYLVQKLVDYLSTYQKDLLIEKIHTYLFLISINQYGTRSLQKIIDKVSNTYQMDLIIKGLQLNDTSSAIEDNNIIKLIKDLNGNHVIQKCIFKFPSEKFQFIIDAICLNNNIVRISTHKHGCCVLQKLLNNANFTQILMISKVLLLFLDELINDQFGNYIIQFLFELDFLKSSSNIDFLVDEFFAKIYKNLAQLSCLKFSSNVIEKFIKVLKIKQNFFYLNEIIKVVNANFELLIKDKFGNYVIQTLIDQFYGVNELNYEMGTLINSVKTYLPVIKSAPYARKIQLKIQQLESNYNLNNYHHSAPAPSTSSNTAMPPSQTGFDSKQAPGFMNVTMNMNNMNINTLDHHHHSMNAGHMNTSVAHSANPNFMPYALASAYAPVADPSMYQPHHPHYQYQNNTFVPETEYFNPNFINQA